MSSNFAKTLDNWASKYKISDLNPCRNCLLPGAPLTGIYYVCFFHFQTLKHIKQIRQIWEMLNLSCNLFTLQRLLCSYLLLYTRMQIHFRVPPAVWHCTDTVAHFSGAPPAFTFWKGEAKRQVGNCLSGIRQLDLLLRVKPARGFFFLVLGATLAASR